MKIKKSNAGPVGLFILATWMMISCGKDDSTAPALQDGKSILIQDLAGDTEAAMGSGETIKVARGFYTFLFRLSDRKQIWIKTAKDSLDYTKTKDWDLAFTGPYNSEIYLNNSQKTENPGYQGAASQTAVVRMDMAYDQIKTAPTDEAFNQSKTEKIGWSANLSDDGWFQYSMNSHIMKAIPNRVYILRLPNGKYAKLQILSAYKGNPAAVTDLNWPAPYYTFRYFVQEDGSKNLSTK